MSTQKQNLRDFSLSELEELLQGMGQPAFRAKQVYGWLHKTPVDGFDAMTNLPKALRTQLEEGYAASLPVVLQKQTSADGTVKYLLQLADGAAVEAVLMRYHHGNTLCVSSQVGCRMGCKFCASTQNGLARNLTAGEMAGEVYAASADSGLVINNVVLMGIGEPLDNLANVLRFILTITGEEGLNLSGRGISLSTCGIVPKMDELAAYKLPLTLSVSLHAASNTKRGAMMPVNDAYPLEQLIPACRRYFETTGRRISFEYAMVHGVNDTEKDANELAALLRGLPAHINLIPVNPVDGSPYGPSEEAAIRAFEAALQKRGLNATVRRRLGTDIDAACGQLRGRHEAGKGT